MAALTPLPEFPEPSMTLRMTQKLLDNRHLLQEGSRITHKIIGRNGWTADISGNVPGKPIRSILEDLMSWWTDNVRDAVERCPEPRNLRRRSEHPKIRNTILQTFRVVGDLYLPSQDWLTLDIRTSLKFDGEAAREDITWPFNLHRITMRTVKAMSEATGQSWKPHRTQPGREPRGNKILETFEGEMTATPLRAVGNWSSRSGRISTKVCQGHANCQYEPKTGDSRKISGCNLAWKEHSEAVFEAFGKANPDLQYGNKGEPCPLEIGQKPHRCYGSDYNLRTGIWTDNRVELQNHDNLCRFPDGEKIIISHPYVELSENLMEEIRKLRGEIPDLDARTGGTERSWFFPRHSHLIVIGSRENLNRVNLDYPVPTGTEPQGCVRWTGN